MGMVFGKVNEETPKFKLVKKTEIYEIREYEPQIRAEVDINTEELSTSSGFQSLAGYIFGDNVSSSSIEMTAPVTTQKNEVIEMTAPVTTQKKNNTTTMAFILPSKYKSLKDLPTPNNKHVRLVQDEPQTMAVLTFGGSWDEETVKEKEKELRNALEKDNVEISNPSPLLFRYNPPFTLWFLRTNEIAFKILSKI